jgi:ClpP class serine protease
MNYPRIIAEIAAHQWAITPAAMDGVLAAVKQELSAEDWKTFHAISKEERPELEAAMGTAPDGTMYTRISGAVGSIFINGPIVPRASFFASMSGLVGVEQLSAEFGALEENPAIKSIVLVMDTPGGAITGISEFASQISAATKPTTAFVAGMAASAGYWIASAADSIVSVDTGIVGSIGVVSTIRVQKDDDRIEVVSAQSPKKRVDVQTPEGRETIQILINDLADVFIDTVAANLGVTREKVLADFGQGDVMVAAKAAPVGMIDGVGTLADVMTQALAGAGYGEPVERFAAAIGADTETTPADLQKPIDKTQTGTNKPIIGAPQAGASDPEKNKESRKMTFEEFLAANPGALAEFEAKIEAARKEERTAAAANEKARIEATEKYLTSDAYPDAVKAVAAEVRNNTAPIAKLEGVVAYHDQTTAAAAAKAAADETKKIEPTPANKIETSPNGVINTEDDYQATVARLRRGKGLEA